MNHPTFTQISAALDGQATGSQGESVRHHMGICPGCRDWRDQLAEESQQLRELLVNEPEPEFFDELFDGIEAAIRADLLEETGPKPVAVKRSLLGLGRKSTPDTPSGQTPRPSGVTPRPSGAAPRPSGAAPRPTGGSPTPVSGATPRPVERAGPRADAGTAPQRDGKRTDDHAPAPPRPAPAEAPRAASTPATPSREAQRPPSDGIVRPPVMQVPADVKPSSAEIVRPGPPLYVPPPAPPTPAERDAIPFTHIITPPHSRNDLHKLAPGDDIGLPEQPTVETTPAWPVSDDGSGVEPPPTLAPRIVDAPGAVTPATPHSRSFPRPLSRGLPQHETSASIPVRGTPRPDEFGHTPSRAMPHPAAHDAPVIEESAYEAPAAPTARRATSSGEGIRITYRELVVVVGALIAFTLIGLGVMRFNRARNAERARHLIEVATPAPAATQPTEPVIPAPAPPSRSTRADKPRTEARTTPARATTREPAETRAVTPARTAEPRTAEPRNETPARQAAPATPAPTRATPTPAAPAPAARAEAASATDEASWPLLCGQVMDDQNLPVSGARVLLADLDLGARTDRNGRFCLSAPPGDRTLSVVALGFKTYRQGIQITDSPAELHVVLHGTQ